MKNEILAVDIGSNNITAVIAEIEGTTVNILGSNTQKSLGIKKGIITNIEEISKSITNVVTEARRIAGSEINEAVISISNAYAKSIKSTGIVNIPHKDISINELNRAMEQSLYNASVPNNCEVIHVLPYNFRVNEQEEIEDPFGMNASRLEVDSNVIITQKTHLSNLKKSVESAGLEIKNIVLGSYASSIATLSEEEKENGAILLDLGGQTSTIAIHFGNSIRFNDYLPVGSSHITSDLSVALHTPLSVAEEVKTHFANLLEKSNESVDLPITGNEEQKNSVSLEVVYSVVFSRVEETLLLLAKQIEKSGLKEKIKGGIVLTGGMSKISGIRELTESIFPNISVRIAKMPKLSGLHETLHEPIYATVLGLILYKGGFHTEYEIDSNKVLLHHKSIASNPKNLDDIKINKESTNVSNQEEFTMNQEVSNGTTGEVFSFENFPDINKNNTKNKLKKVTTWAKQLF